LPLSLLVASLYSVGNMWYRNSAVVSSFFLNQLKTASSLNCLLCIIHLWWSTSKSVVHSLRLSLVFLGFWSGLLNFRFEEALSTVVSTVCRGRGKVLLLFDDFVLWEDSACAIICAASLWVRYGWVCGGYSCVERSLRNSSSEYGVFAFDWDLDRFVGDICGVFSWHEVCPMEIDVVLSSVDEGSKEMEVVSSGVHPDEDDPMFGSQCEDGRGGEAIATEVGVLVHLSVIGAISFLAVEGMYE